jgi:hypothetical protein
VFSLVVCGHGDVNVLERRVRVAERNDGDVDVRCFLDCLGVGAGIGDDDETGFTESTGDVVGEGS